MLAMNSRRGSELFLPPTTSWEGGHGRELPNQVYQKPSQGIPQLSWRKGSVFMQNLQEQAESRRGTVLCRRILLQEPRGKLSQATRTQGGQPVVELVALVMEQQRMRVTSQ